MAKTYKVSIGLIKSLKNVAITFGAPIVLVLLNNYTEWLPTNTAVSLAPFIGYISYFIKNYIENKNLK